MLSETRQFLPNGSCRNLDNLVRRCDSCTSPTLPRLEAQINDDRIHRAVSTDGTEIVGRVRGQGPPLVLVHGGLADGETSWDSLLPHLTEEFTCYLMSTRGVGLSAEPPNADYSLNRHVDDVVAFSESIGEAVILLGYSLGGALSLGAAARSNAIAAVAVYEPAVFEVPSPTDPSSAKQKVARIMEAVADNRLAAAARAMIEDVATESELARLSDEGFFQIMAQNVPVAVQVMQQASASDGPSPTNAAGLGRIRVPILYMHGSETRSTWYIDATEYLREHAETVRVLEITGGGHFALRFAPDEIARALIAN